MLLNDNNHMTKKTVPGIGTIVLLLVFINAAVLKFAYVYNDNLYKVLYITLPLLLVSAIYNRLRKRMITNTYQAAPAN